MRMAPIECFPFAHGCPPKDNPMHDRVLLVKLRPPKIAFGFARYNVLNDVFQVCQDGFYQTENYAYTEYPAIGSYADRQKPSAKPIRMIFMSLCRTNFRTAWGHTVSSHM